MTSEQRHDVRVALQQTRANLARAITVMQQGGERAALLDGYREVLGRLVLLDRLPP